MIKHVSHQVTGIGGGPAALPLALAVAHELYPPIPGPRTPEAALRAPEVVPAVPELMGLRTSAARPHRRKVPLHRLATMRGLSALGI